MDLEALPEGCIANVIGLTTPRDACMLSLIWKNLKSAADSDTVWDKFLPPDTNEILSKSRFQIRSKSRKKLYLTLSHNPILINDGNMSFSLDKWSGKKSYMIGARRLRIRDASDDTPRYWEWISLPKSKSSVRTDVRCRNRSIGSRRRPSFVLYFGLKSVGELKRGCCPHSRHIKLIWCYKLTEGHLGLNSPAVVRVGARAHEFDYECPNLEQIAEDITGTVFLAPRRAVEERELQNRIIRSLRWRLPKQKEAKFPNEERGDGWLEVELGGYHCQGDEDGELEMICHGIRGLGGLLVQGIEIRPEQRD